MNGEVPGVVVKLFGVVVITVGGVVVFSSKGQHEKASLTETVTHSTEEFKITMTPQKANLFDVLRNDRRSIVEISSKKTTTTSTRTGDSSRSKKETEVEVDLTDPPITVTPSTKVANKYGRHVVETTFDVFKEVSKRLGGPEGECESPDSSSDEDSSEMDSSEESELQRKIEYVCSQIFIRESEDKIIKLAPTFIEAFQSLFRIGYDFYESCAILLALYRSEIILIHFGWGGLHLILVEDENATEVETDDEND